MRRVGRVWTAAEWVGFQFHGHNITHIDALCHGSFDAEMYNGIPANAVNVTRGATKLSVTAGTHDFTTRGVLLDIAAVRGVPWLDSGEGVFPDDLEEAERRQGVVVREGDFVIIHTGHAQRIVDEGIVPKEMGWPGWHAASLPWIHERGVVAIGADL